MLFQLVQVPDPYNSLLYTRSPEIIAAAKESDVVSGALDVSTGKDFILIIEFSHLYDPETAWLTLFYELDAIEKRMATWDAAIDAAFGATPDGGTE